MVVIALRYGVCSKTEWKSQHSRLVVVALICTSTCPSHTRRLLFPVICPSPGAQAHFSAKPCNPVPTLHLFLGPICAPPHCFIYGTIPHNGSKGCYLYLYLLLPVATPTCTLGSEFGHCCSCDQKTSRKLQIWRSPRLVHSPTTSPQPRNPNPCTYTCLHHDLTHQSRAGISVNFFGSGSHPHEGASAAAAAAAAAVVAIAVTIWGPPFGVLWGELFNPP